MAVVVRGGGGGLRTDPAVIDRVSPCLSARRRRPLTAPYLCARVERVVARPRPLTAPYLRARGERVVARPRPLTAPYLRARAERVVVCCATFGIRSATFDRSLSPCTRGARGRIRPLDAVAASGGAPIRFSWRAEGGGGGGGGAD